MLNLKNNYTSRLRKLLRGQRKKIIRRTEDWAIAIYIGNSPFDLLAPKNLRNPILTAKDIVDIPADFVADPFMVHHDGVWYMFFEIMNAETKKGDIGLATSKDGYTWDYKQVVLSEPFHLSYPYVFEWNNNFYIVPETYKAQSIRLYKATKFPTEWAFVKPLLTDKDYVDSSIVYFNNFWWLFTSSTQSNTLYLYYSSELTGSWIEHPESPIIIDDKRIARPGGRVIPLHDHLIRYTQDDTIIYGNQVRAYKITEITTENYQEQAIDKNPVLKAAKSGWNEVGMHHIDPHSIDKNQWIACVDGYQVYFMLGNRYKYPGRWLNYILNILNLARLSKSSK
jgi:hypothetical protein